MREPQPMRRQHHGVHPRRQRVAIYSILGTLWLSGCVWLVLDTMFAPHALEPTVLLLHGIIAVLCMYLLGWVSARHVLRWWPSRRRRVSGGALAAFFAALSLSGFALFFLTADAWQHASAVLHDVLGVGVSVFACQHWFLARRRDIRSAASRP